MMRNRNIGAALVVTVGALSLPACGGSGGGGGTEGGTHATPGEGSFRAYDWEPNVVAQPGAKDAGTGMSRTQAEQLAANREGTIVLLGPAALDIPTTKFDESKATPRNYYVLRDRPALDESDVERATIQPDPTTGQTSIIVYLTPEGQSTLGELTLRQARRGSTPPPGPLGGLSIGPQTAIVVGDEILLIQQLGPGRYTNRPIPAITVVGAWDKERAQELANAIDPGSDTAPTVTLGAG